MPKDLSDNIKASVPLLVAIQYLAPMYFENFFSNSVIFFPSVKSVVLINFFHSAKIYFVFANSNGR